MSEELTVQNNRKIATITTEIKTIVRQTQQIILTNAMEIGKRLIEAKELVPYGEWGNYLEKEVEFSQSTANNMMQLYREYGNDQQSLFGGNSKSFGELPYTKALKLLAIPEEDREEFAKEVDIDNISTRELEKEIRARQEAEREKEAAQKLQQIAQEQVEEERSKVDKLTCEIAQKEKDTQNLHKDIDILKSQLAEARKAEQKAAKEAKEAKAKANQVPDALMEQLRKDAEAAAAEDARKRIEELEAKAVREAERLAAEKAQLEEQLDAAKKAMQLSSPKAAVFMAHFNTIQEDYNRLIDCLLKVREEDAELGIKLQKATEALIGKMQDRLRGEG